MKKKDIYSHNFDIQISILYPIVMHRRRGKEGFMRIELILSLFMLGNTEFVP